MGTYPNIFMYAIGGVEILELSRFEQECYMVLLGVLGFKSITILRDPRADSGPFQVLSFILLAH